MQADAMRDGYSAPGCLRYGGLRREVPFAVSIECRCDAIVVSLNRLVHAFGESQIGERVIEIEERIGFRVDRRRLCRGWLRKIDEKRDTVWIGPVARAPDEFHQLHAIEHIPRFDRFD